NTPNGDVSAKNGIDLFSIDASQDLSFTLTASDSDADGSASNLQFELAGNKLPGMTIEPSSTAGEWVVEWPANIETSGTTVARPQGEFAITVRVTDNGTPTASTSRTILVAAGDQNSAPEFLGFSDTNGNPISGSNFIV